MLLPQLCRKDAFAPFKDLSIQKRTANPDGPIPEGIQGTSQPRTSIASTVRIWARAPSLVLTTWNGRLGNTFLDTKLNTCNPMRFATRTKWWTASWIHQRYQVRNRSFFVASNALDLSLRLQQSSEISDITFDRVYHIISIDFFDNPAK